VAVGGGDGGGGVTGVAVGVDRDLDEGLVALTGDEPGDGLGGGLAGLGVGGQDEVAELDVADGRGGAVG
jgi:hypothetical protein